MRKILLVIALVHFAGTALGQPKGTPPPPKCEYVAYGVAPVLIKGGRRQSLSLRSLDASCDRKLTQIARNWTAKQAAAKNSGPAPELPIVLRDPTNPNVVLPASFTVFETLGIDYVPASLAPQVHLEMYDTANGKQIGVVDLQTATLSRDPGSPLRVEYRDEALDRLQDHRNADWIAVAGKDVTNTVALKLPPELPVTSDDVDYWYVRSASWQDVEFQAASRDDAGAELKRVDDLSFSPPDPRDGPLHVALSLRRAQNPQKHDPANDPPWFEVDLELASRARKESLPFGISRYLVITCTSNRTQHDTLETSILAIDNDALERGACTLSLRKTPNTKRELDAASVRALDDRDAELSRLLSAYGPQTIRVVVSRTKARDRALIWTVNGVDSQMVLFPPEEDDKGEGPYTVIAQLTTKAGQAVYRSGVSISETDPENLADYRFSARLRPRGEYATLQRYRLFATFPVDLLAMRFPASIRDVDRSSNGRVVQISSLRAGIQFVFEPWDYARARNGKSIPVRAMAGFGLFELSESRFAPTFDIGGAVVIGVLGENKLPTSVTIGVLYELDLRDPRRGSHVLFTSSVNFLSLFGAQSTGK